MNRKSMTCLLLLCLLLACLVGLVSCQKCKHEDLTYAVTVPPECEKEGSESALCPACGETQTRPVPATGHSFENGYCGSCQTGLYTNLLSSLSVNGMTLSVDGLRFSNSYEDVSGTPIITVYEQTAPTRFTWNGTEGSAVCHMKVTTVEGDGMTDGDMESGEIDLLLTFSVENGIGTTITAQQEIGSGLFAETTSFTWTSVGELAGSAELSAVIKELEPLLARTAEEQNAACRAMLFFLSCEKTDGGYLFTPDADTAKEQIDRIFAAESLFDAVDVIYGEGTVEHIRSELRALCSLTVREAWDKMRAAGVNTERLWDAIEALTESETNFLTDPAILSLRLYQVIEAAVEDIPLPTSPISAEEAGTAFDAMWTDEIAVDGEKSLAEAMEMTDVEWQEERERAQDLLDDFFAAFSLTYTTDALGNLTEAETSFDLAAFAASDETLFFGPGVTVEGGLLRLAYTAAEVTEKHALDIDKVLSDVSKTKATLPVAQDLLILDGAAAMMYGDTLRVSAEPIFEDLVELVNKKTGQSITAYAQYSVAYTATTKLTVRDLQGLQASPTDRVGVYALTLLIGADKAVLGVPKLIEAYAVGTYNSLNVADYTFAESPEVPLDETEIAVLALYNGVTGAVTAPIAEEDPNEPTDPDDEELYLVCFYEEDGETLIDCVYAEYGEDVTAYAEYFVSPTEKPFFEFVGWESEQNVSLDFITDDCDFYPIYMPIDDDEDGSTYLMFDGCIPLVDSITVDGFWDDAYQNAAVLPLDTSRQADGKTSTRVFTDVDGVGYLVWDGEYIYVFVTVADPTLGGRSQAYIANVFNAYLNDTVEVYYSLYQGARDANSMKIGIDSMGVGKYCTKKLSEVNVGDTGHSTHFDEIRFATSSAITPHGSYGSYNDELTEDPFHWFGTLGEYSYCVEIAIPARTEGVADVYNDEGLSVDPLTGFIRGRENADGSRTDDPDDYRFTDGEALIAGDLVRFNLQIIDLPLSRAELGDLTNDCHEDEDLDETVGRNSYLYDAAGREVTPAFCAYGHTQFDLSRYLTFVLGDEGEEGYSCIYDFDEYGNPVDEYGEITELYAAE